MKYIWKRRIFSFIIAAGCSAALMNGAFLTAHAEVIDYRAQLETYKQIQVDTNVVDNWPQGPVVSAKSAILMDADTGAILYSKNIHEKLYPASTTKILTAYIARQKSGLDEMVEYSSEAVNSIDWRSDSNIGIKAGEAITMEQSLYGLLVGSASECGNAIGEHISGSVDAFVKLMNETAKNLGCTETHFVNTNGKHDEEHYTSTHDLALIAQQFFADEVLCKMSGTRSYTIPASPTLSQELIPNSKNNLLPGKAYAYEYLVGSKTGYTPHARSNLVSCAEKDGLKLICVVMADESPEQFQDTVSLFDYGFSNFSSVQAADEDTTYNVGRGGLFSAGGQQSAQILSIDPEAKVTLPATVEFADLTSELSYDDTAAGQAAIIHYSYNGQPLGTAPILFHDVAAFDFNAQPLTEEEALALVSQTGEAQTEEEASQDGSAAAAAVPMAVSDTGSDGTQGGSAASDAEAVSGTAASDEAASEKEGALPESSAPAPSESAGPSVATPNGNVIFLNIKNILIAVGIIAAVLITALVIRSVIVSRRRNCRRQAIMKRRRESRGKEIINFDKYIDPNL